MQSEMNVSDQKTLLHFINTVLVNGNSRKEITHD